MNKKKISLKDWTYIGKYNRAAKWCRPICSYYLIREDEKYYRREQYINWFAYILIFIPIHILQAFVCMWDGGLKDFQIFKRYLGADSIGKGDSAYLRAEAVWTENSAEKC